MYNVRLSDKAEARWATFTKLANAFDWHTENDEAHHAHAHLQSARKVLPSLLTQSVKTIKSLKVKAETGILYLSPSTESGVNLCPFASAGCAAACLGHSSGQMVFPTSREARVLRSRAFLQHRPLFLAILRHEIALLVKRAERNGNRPFVRLNGTSDVTWESVAPDLFAEFPEVQFYDYTKNAKRFDRALPENYHLTFSRSEDNDEACSQVLRKGFNVAMVFRSMPETLFNALDGQTYTVVDGDETDARPDDRHGVIVGLTAKGAAKKDKSGFVIG